MLTCAKCNYENELGRIFCHQCGNKLDLESIKPPSRGGKSLKKSKYTVAHVVGLSIRIIVVGVLVLVLALMFQVPQIEEVPTSVNDLNSFIRKKNNLENATFQRKPIAVSFTEAELNAYIDNVQSEKPEGRGVAIVPTNFQIDIEPEEVRAAIVGKIVVNEKWEKGIAITYTGVPGVENSKFVFQPKAARIGKLSVPRFLLTSTPMIENYFKQVFGKLDAEIQLLNRMSSIDLDAGTVVLEYKPAEGETTKK